jgi:hypothetical protein
VSDERANEGLDHLQTAALELIHAARAFLDVAEDVVTDNDKVAEIVEVLGSVADAASRAARGEPLRAHRGRDRHRGADDEDRGEDPDGGSGGVEHIPVS